MESVGWHQPPDPAVVSAWALRSRPPANELPVRAELPEVLYRGDAVGVGLLGAVYSTGLSMTVTLRLRHPPTGAPHRLGSLLGDHPDSPADERFLFGVQLSDGQRVRPLDRPGPPFGDPSAAPVSPTGHSLTRNGGHSGGDTVETTYWLSPLPPAGPTGLVLRCPALGLPETTVEFDATPIVTAAARVTVLWPPVTARPPVVRPRPPEPPTEGWFAVRS